MLKLYTKQDLKTMFDISKQTNEPFAVVLSKVKLINETIEPSTEEEKDLTNENVD